AFDGGDVLVRDRPQRHVAGGDGAAADHDVAGAALARAAAEMRAGQAEGPAQHIEQRAVGIGVDFGLHAVEAKTDTRHYWDFSLNRFTTSAHLTMSPRKYASNSVGVIDIGSAPWPVHSLTISGRLTAAFSAAFSLSMIGFGVPAGAI